MSKSHQDEFEQFESRYRENPQTLVFARLAAGYLERGDAKRAMAICLEGVKRFPSYMTGRLVLGRCYMAEARYDEAAGEFRQACRLERRSPAALRFLADALTQTHQSAAAESVYAYLLECDPDNSTLHSLVGTVSGRVPDDVLDAVGVFGDQAQPASSPPQTGTPAPEATASTADEVHIEELVEAEKAPTAESPVPEQSGLGDFIENADTIALTPGNEGGASSEEGLTGQDVSFRIDALFGEDGPAPSSQDDSASQPKMERDQLTELFAAGQFGGSSQFDTGRFSMGDMLEGQTQELSPDVVFDDAAVGDEAFDATMAFDASVLNGESAPDVPPEGKDEELSSTRPIEYFEHEDEAVDEMDEFGGVGLSGADVSSRLDEMFDTDMSEGNEEDPQSSMDTVWTAPPAPSTTDFTHTPLSGFTRSDIDTATTEMAEFPEEATQELGGPPSGADVSEQPPVFGETSELNEADLTDVLGGSDTVFESGIAEARLSEELPSSAAVGQHDEDTTGFHAGRDREDGTDTSAYDEIEPTPSTSRFSLANDVITPSDDETTDLSLDQEMSFDDDQGETLEDLIGTLAAEVEAVDTDGGDPMGSMPSDQSNESDDTRSMASSATTAFTRRDDDDLFSSGPDEGKTSRQGPQTMQERADEAQTLEFARDELEDLVALSGSRGFDEHVGDAVAPAGFEDFEEDDETRHMQIEEAVHPHGEDTEWDLHKADTEGLSPEHPRSSEDSDGTGSPAGRNSDAQPLPEDLITARTEKHDVAGGEDDEHIEHTNPFAAYANEISQAQTLQFRREDLQRYSDDQESRAEEEERAELHKQVSQAHTVALSREEIGDLVAEDESDSKRSEEESRGAAMDEPTDTATWGPTFVDTSMIFIDEESDSGTDATVQRTDQWAKKGIRGRSEGESAGPSSPLAQQDKTDVRNEPAGSEPRQASQPSEAAPHVVSPFAIDPFLADADQVGQDEQPGAGQPVEDTAGCGRGC